MNFLTYFKELFVFEKFPLIDIRTLLGVLLVKFI